jgi:hypothetical protein
MSTFARLEGAMSFLVSNKMEKLLQIQKDSQERSQSSTTAIHASLDI